MASSHPGNTTKPSWVSYLVNLSGFTNQLAVGMIHFLPPLYALKLGTTPVTVGLIAASSSIAGFISALPAGKMIDRLGPRKAILYSAACKVVATLIFVLIQSPIGLTIPSFLTGMLGTITILGLHNYVSRLSHGAERTKGMSDFGLFSSAGDLAGAPLAGIMVDLVSYEAAFVVSASIAALSWIFLYYLPVLPEAIREGERRKPVRGFRGLLAHRGIQGNLLASGSFAFMRSFHRAFFPVLFFDVYSATEIGSLFFIAAAATLLGRSAFRWTGQFLSLQNSTTASIFGSAFPLILMPLFQSFSTLSVLMAIFGFFNGFLNIVTTLLTAEHAASLERGLAYGMRTTVMRFSSFSGQVVFGMVAELTSVFSAFWGVGILGSFVGIFLTRLMRSRGRDSDPPARESGE